MTQISTSLQGGRGPADTGPATFGSDKLRAALAALDDLGLEQLRSEWRRLNRTPAPGRLSRDILIRGIAYKLQEAAIGGLSRLARRKLEEDEGGSHLGAGKPIATATRLQPGAMLVREWHGRGHIVLVQERGFEHEGRHYASLSEIARHITGAHWSGPRFFGLTRARGRGIAITASAGAGSSGSEAADA